MNEIGNTYGRLTVIESAGKSKRGLLLWKCSCSCGSEVVVAGALMRSGNTSSCGCLRREAGKVRATKHGLFNQPWRHSYASAKARCTNPNHKNWSEYGGRGIKFNFESLKQFAEVLGHSWAKGLTLERIDNNGHYEPGNCRWATRAEQCLNTRRSRKITFNGETLNLHTWAKRLGVSDRTLAERIAKCGVDQALNMEKRDPHQQVTYTINGITKTQRAWCAELGITVATLKGRLKVWTLEKALSVPNTRKSPTQQTSSSC